MTEQKQKSIFCLLLNKVAFTTSNLKCQQFCKKETIRMLISHQRWSYCTHYLSIIHTADFMHQRFKLTSSTLPQVRSLLKLFVNWSHLHKKNKMHQENEQPHNLFKAWNAGGSKWFPAKEPEQLYLAFWVSTSHSLNPTHIKLFLCHDAAFHAFHFQFTSELLLPSHQLASCCRFFFPCQAYILVKITIFTSRQKSHFLLEMWCPFKAP